ncbi:MAG: CPBP family intramembrane metalloprotease [Proteobacteria bacterium]|nr:CPBP family intramembrane metalloprotease [Pseudomonadota bacterium]
MIGNGTRPIPKWSPVIFAVVMPALVAAGLWLLPDRNVLPMLGLFFTCALVAVAVTLAPMGPRAILPALGFRRAGWKMVVFGTLGALVVSVGVSQLGIEPEGVKEALGVARDPAMFTASLLVMAVLAPLAEEVVFRGLLYGWLDARWGATVAWAASSLLFAAAHFEPAHIILVLPLGLWFGFLRLRSGSLWPSLVAHVVNNGMAVVAGALAEAAT